uniref:Uncharacterized protein n=1 Tax=Chelonoidis abingdonii TaxID=106734 RepID=A0A8C0GGV8_CHEAB
MLRGWKEGWEEGSTQSRTHLEVLRIHMQLLAVQLAQLCKGFLDVVQVLHSVPKRSQHLLAMGKDLGVVEDGAGAGEVPKGGEKPLGPGVDDQQPRERETQGFATNLLHIDLGPQAGNVLLLFGCPVHHGGESGSARHVSCCPGITQRESSGPLPSVLPATTRQLPYPAAKGWCRGLGQDQRTTPAPLTPSKEGSP